MNMVSHVAMRTQVRPRTESEEKFRYEKSVRLFNLVVLLSPNVHLAFASFQA